MTVRFRTLAVFLFLACAALGQVSNLPTGVTVAPFYDTTKAGLSFRKDQQSVVGMWEVPGKPMHFLVLGYWGYMWSLYPEASKPVTPTGMLDYTKRQLADFNTMVMKGWEQGALGGGFDPDFKQNRFFYIIYNKYANEADYHGGVKPTSVDGPNAAGLVVVERWKLSENLQTLTRDATVLSMDHGKGYGSSNMVFGKDGYLYITTDSYSRNSWDSTDYMRKILRIDVSRKDPGRQYAIPSTNPWVKATNPAVKKEVFAFGFRNTYSLQANYLTGSILGAEVGQSTWEEVNVILPGRNYGWADGGDGQSSKSGVGIEGPCHQNTKDGVAFSGTVKNPYSYQGPTSQGRAVTCADFTNGTWNFHHGGVDLGGSKTALPGLKMNCIILSPAFRGDPSSPFHGYHFVTDVASNYFVALREGESAVKNVGGFPSSYVFTGDKAHNGTTAFGEDSYGNLYAVPLSSSAGGAFAWHDILRVSHPQLKPLATPRDQVVPAASTTAIPARRAGALRPMISGRAGAGILLPPGATRLELYGADGKRVWAEGGKPGDLLRVPSERVAEAVWFRFLP